MALTTGVTIEVRLTGSDTNGGGWLPFASGTDWSQQDTAQYSVTDGVTAGTTTITSATANFGTDVVGNVMYVAGGTGSVTGNWYQIASRTNATTIVVDRSTGLTAGTGVTLKIGGALASPGGASKLITDSLSTAVSYIKVYVKYNASPYVITSATASIAGGCVSMNNNQIWVGYDTVRSEYQIGFNRPTLQLNAGVSTAIIIGNLNAQGYTQGFILDGNSQTSSKGYHSSGQVFYCKAINCTNSAIIQNSAGGRFIYCEVTQCTTPGVTLFSASSAYFCSIHDNTNTGGTNIAAALSIQATFIGCLSYNNVNYDGFGNTQSNYLNCVAYNNTYAGFNAHNGTNDCVNCIAENNGTYGYRTNAAGSALTLINCASYNNATSRFLIASSRVSDVNPIAGTSSFFTNAAGGDFTLNANTTGGLLCRTTGFPVNLLGLGNDYGDVGALQHVEAALTPISPSLVQLPQAFPWPNMLPSITAAPSNGSYTTLTTAGSHYTAFVFCAQEDMTITHVASRSGVATGSPAFDVRIETVDATGFPSGTLWSTTTNGASGTVAATAQVITALTSPAVIPRGSIFCVKFLFSTGTTINLTNITGVQYPQSDLPYVVQNTGTPTKALGGNICIALGNSATTFYSVPGAMYVSGPGGGSFTNASGAKRGLKFNLPFNCRVIGIKNYFGASNGNFNAMITDSAGTEVGSSSTAFDGDHNANLTTGVGHVYFDNAVMITAYVDYRAILEPTTTTGVNISTWALVGAIFRQATPPGLLGQYTTCTSGVWTDSTTQIPLFDILIDQVPDGIAYGNSPVGDFKMFGRGAPY